MLTSGEHERWRTSGEYGLEESGIDVMLAKKAACVNMRVCLNVINLIVVFKWEIFFFFCNGSLFKI